MFLKRGQALKFWEKTKKKDLIKLAGSDPCYISSYLHKPSYRVVSRVPALTPFEITSLWIIFNWMPFLQSRVSHWKSIQTQSKILLKNRIFECLLFLKQTYLKVQVFGMNKNYAIYLCYFMVYNAAVRSFFLNKMLYWSLRVFINIQINRVTLDKCNLFLQLSLTFYECNV